MVRVRSIGSLRRNNTTDEDLSKKKPGNLSKIIDFINNYLANKINHRGV